MIKLSVITVHLNNFSGLDATYRSLSNLLSGDRVEWIVIDGASVPQSAEDVGILDHARNQSSFWVAEPDNGPYDAMNKGTSLATGEYLLYLNSGDELHPIFQFEKFQTIVERDKPDMLWGICYDLDSAGNVYPRKTRHPELLRFGMVAAHQSILFRRRALQPAPYDLRYPIGADYDLICRLYLAGARVILSPFPVCVFQLQGLSSANKERALRDESAIRAHHFPAARWLGPVIYRAKLYTWRLNERFVWLRRAWRQWL